MGRRLATTTDTEVYVEPTGEAADAQQHCSSLYFPSSRFEEVVTFKDTKSNTNNTRTTKGTTLAHADDEAFPAPTVVGIRLKEQLLSSMSRMKTLSKIGSHNNYEQLRPPSSSSDNINTEPAGIFSGHNQNSLQRSASPSPTHRLSLDKELVVVRNGETAVSTAAAAGAAAAAVATVATAAARGRDSEYFLNGENVIRRNEPAGQCGCPGEENIGRQSPRSSRPVREELMKKVDSFDDVDQFQRQASVSVSENRRRSSDSDSDSDCLPCTGNGTTPPRVPAPRVVQFPDDSLSVERGAGSEGVRGLGIQHEDNHNLRRNGLLIKTSDSSGYNTTRTRERSFDFGTRREADPPNRLIGAFLQRQTESGSNFLDLDLDMDELSPSLIASEEAEGLSTELGEQQQQSTGPGNGHIVKESSYADLVLLDHPLTSSVPASFKVGAQIRPHDNELTKDQASKYNSDPLFRQGGMEDVAINVGGDEKYGNGMEDANVAAAAAAFRNSSPPNGIAAAGHTSSPGTGGEVRWRRNSSFKPQSPPLSAAEVEVLKAPAQITTRPTFTRMKSRLADIPRPPDTKASGLLEEKLKSGQVPTKNSGQLKSGLQGNKLKKVPEEEEEDPLKVTDLPEKYRRRDKGFWNVFQCVAFLLIIGGLATVLAFPRLRRTKRGGLLLWKWALLVMVVFSGRLISGWIIWVLVFIIEKNFLLRKRVVYFVYALRKGVQNCVWLGFALLAWHLMVDPKVEHSLKAVKYVTKVLVCFLVAAMLVLIKTLIVKVFASSFHVNNYFERIQEALFNQYIMETLSGPPIFEFEENLDEEKRLNDEIAGLREAGATGPSFSKIPDLPPPSARPSGLAGGRPSLSLGSGVIGSGMIGRSPKAGDKKKKSASQKELNQGISLEHLQRLDLTNISAWNMKRLMHIVKNSTLTHSLEETINAEGVEETEIQSEWQAKCAAKQIFRNVAKPCRKVITEDDLLRFMREEEMIKALPLFDGAVEKKCITKQVLKTWVINVYRERRALALSLNDTKTAVNKLHRIVDFVVGIIIIIIWLLVLGIATTKLLLFMSSQILLLILVWGNTLKTVFEAIVFLFVMHPFDVGDRCVIDGNQLVVEEMNILTTVFIGDFNVKVWFPNSVLATKPIQNFYRSPEMGDGVNLIVHSSTPVEKIAALKEKIGIYVTSKPEFWHQDFSLNVLEMTEGDRMKMLIGVKHTMNYQDMGEIVKRRSELLLEVKFCLHELSIEYHLPAQEVHVRKLKD